MSQSNHLQKANSKQKRQRTNSQGQGSQRNHSNSPWKNDADYVVTGGNGSARKNKPLQGYPSGGNHITKTYNSSRTELQSLLNCLPSSQVFDNSHKNRSSEYPSQNHLGKRRGSLHDVTSYTDSGAGAMSCGTESRSGVEDEDTNRLNSSALRRIDTAFSKLHGTASQVAVYRYNPSTQSWDKTDTVGCLFLYERNAPPKYGLVVMNRKSVSNFIQCFGPDGQVVLNPPYLLLRSVEDLNNDPGDGSQTIHCIWFYDGQECAASADILRKMGLKFEGDTDSRGFGLQGQSAGNALFQILLQGKRESPQVKMKPKVMTAEELESQMLDESSNNANKGLHIANTITNGLFHGKAQPSQIGGSPAISAQKGASSGSSSVFHQFLNMSMKDKKTESKVRGEPVTCELTSVTQASMAQSLGSQNQMRTVEQLERDMKKDRSSDSSSASNTTTSTTTVAIQNELMQTLGIPNMAVMNKTDYNHEQPTGPMMTPQFFSGNKSVERTMLDNIIGKSVDETDPEEIRQVFQNIETSNLILVTETVPGANEARLTWRLNRSSSLLKDDSTFTTPTGEYVSATGTRCSSQLGEGRYFDNSIKPVEIKPNPLTKDQLGQALMHLLQNDADFITKIHDAYVKSLQQAFEGRHF